MEEERKLKIINITGSEEYQRLIVPGTDSFNIKAGSLTLEPGRSVGEHSTGDREEAIIVFQGTAEIFYNGQSVKATDRTVVYMPPRTRHNVKNIGEGKLKYVFLVVPL